MRPLRLELRGFTAFREKVVVDFSGRELFAITGPTGAGKSSLLDGMTWALYGRVPRVGRQTRQLISHGEKSMTARLDFTVRGEGYRVVRRAPATTGTRLEQILPDGTTQPLSDRANDVTARITQLLGMDYDTFTKTVLLPQNAFDSFLRGDDQQRRMILTRLLGLGTYEEARRSARERANQGTAAATLLEGQLEQLSFSSPEAATELAKRFEQAEARHAELESRRGHIVTFGELFAALDHTRYIADEARRTEAAASTRASDTAEALATATHDRNAADSERTRLEQEQTALSYDPEEHERTNRELERANHELKNQQLRQQASEAVDRARAELIAAGADEIDAIAAENSAIASGANHAKAIATARTRLALTSSEVAKAATQVSLRAEELNHKKTELGKIVHEAEAKAGAQERRAEELDQIAEQLAMRLTEHEVAEDAHRSAAEAALTSSKSAVAAHDLLATAESVAKTAIEAQKNAQHQHSASTLRQGLAPGDPCPVCGEPVSAAQASRSGGPAPPGRSSRKNAAQSRAANDLAAADTAVQKSNHHLVNVRADSLRLDTEAARTETAEENATEIVTRSASKLSDLDTKIAEIESSRDTLKTDAARCRDSAISERSSAHDASVQLQSTRDEERILSDLLARTPPELIEASPANASDPDAELSSAALATTLSEAIEAQKEAEDHARQSEAEEHDQIKNIAAAKERLQASQKLRVSIEHGYTEAEERLATLPDESDTSDLDSDALNARLTELERAKNRASELVSEMRAAEAEAVRQAVRHEERSGEAVRAGTEAEQAGAKAERAIATAVSVANTTLQQARDLFPEATAGVEDETINISALLEAEAQAREAAAAELAKANTLLAQGEREVTEAKRMRTDIATHREHAALANALEQELRGNRFIAYVQQEAMAVLAQDAAARLEQLTSGRYRLLSEDGQFTIIDQFNGDEQRSVRTLSGGETFLASLALSLALSERLPELAGTGAAVSLESLFIDEGFGTLDAESLDLAVQGLETLAGGQRMVGAISHVSELAERLSDRIKVIPGVHGSAISNV